MIFCSKCGIQISIADATCPSCLQPLPAQTNPVPCASQSNQAVTPPDLKRHPYYGVDGWLLLFVISLAILTPLAYLWAVMRQFEQNLELFEGTAHPYSLYASYFAKTISSFVLYGYGVFAGIQLWRIRPRAVHHAKVFLIVLLLYRSAVYLVRINWLALIAPGHSDSTALAQLLAGNSSLVVLRSAIWVGVWYSYLTHSERVRVTYGEDT
jgi:hypothetical protein